MIFAIDVRHMICKQYSELEELIAIRVKLKRFIEDEKDESIKVQMQDAFNCLDTLITLKQDKLSVSLDTFEKEFIDDVMSNYDFYMMKRTFD